MMGRGFIVLASLALAGCASMGGYRPTVDPYNDPHKERLAQDEAECRRIAEQSAGTAQKTVVGAAVGGLIGAAGGAAIGAAAGNPGMGAAVGAATGGVGGGGYEGLSAEERFKRVFRNCMRNRGHNVLD
ncbi:MAG TPA: glycine zipper family protein [Candidatus Binatia bacterium]|jgi:uncharacterized protein YcfJ|nr:glycine zipper family protein [Candidatus Binatia bacterium]